MYFSIISKILIVQLIKVYVLILFLEKDSFSQKKHFHNEEFLKIIIF